jgi:hypothetical protein
MLKILIDTQFTLDIDSETAVQIEYENPLFVFDALPGAATYNFTIPASPNNNQTFEQANTIATDTRSLGTYPCQIFADEIPLLKGFLTIESATQNRYNCSIACDFLETLREVYLDTQFIHTETTTIDFGTPIEFTQQVLEGEYIGNGAIAEAHANAANAATYPAYTHCFPVMYNEAFFSTAATFPEIAPEWLSPYDPRNNYSNLITAGQTPVDNNRLVPCMYVAWALAATMQKNNLLLSGNALDDPEWNSLIIYNNFALDNWILDINTHLTDVQYARHLPNILVSDFLLDLRKKFNLCFFFDLNTNAVGAYFAHSLATNPTATDISQYIEPQYSIQFGSQTKAPTLCHLPDETDAYATRFDEEITDFTLSGQANTVDGLPAYAPADQIYYVVSENAYYHYTETEDPGAPGTNIAQWQRFSYKYECATNDGSNIESTLPLLMAELPRFGSDNPNTTWVVPRTEHAGSALALLNRTNPSLLPDAIYSYPYNHHPFALRYAFYRGLQPDSQLAGYEYPLATPTAFNAHGDRVGNYTLDFNGTDGIYAQFWKPFIDRIADAKVVEKTLIPNALFLSQLNMATKYAIQESTGITNYFIKKLTVTLTATAIEKSKLTLVQVI